MLENAVDVETRGFELTCDPNLVMGDSPVRPPNFTPAILLFDYGAAFPSLSRDFLWLCLAAVGFPIFIINAMNKSMSATDTTGVLAAKVALSSLLSPG